MGRTGVIVEYTQNIFKGMIYLVHQPESNHDEE
jgi:hypothetical protein